MRYYLERGWALLCGDILLLCIAVIFDQTLGNLGSASPFSDRVKQILQAINPP